MAGSVERSDFSGGLQEALSPSDFTERQWAELKGFVLENEVSVRSQWALQKVGGKTDLTDTYAFTGKNSRWLIALDALGNIWYTPAPSRLDTFNATATHTWFQLTAGVDVKDGTAVTIPANTDYRFITQTIVRGTGAEHQGGVLIHAAGGTSPGIILHEAGSDLKAVVYQDFYPHGSTVNGEYVVESKKMPRANVGVMWGSLLVLGDTEWFKDPNAKDVNGNPVPLGGTLQDGTKNIKRYTNGLWTSHYDLNGSFIDQFHPAYGFDTFASAETRITGLRVVEDGLLVFTSTAGEDDGVILLRGMPGKNDSNLPNFRPVKLAEGLGTARHTTIGHHAGPSAWPESSTVTWVQAKGSVWQTNGQEYGRIDRYGAKTPDNAGEFDHTAAIGPYLFLSRAGRLLVMRMFSEDGSWSELVLPSAHQPRSMSPLEDCLYFVANGVLWRYAMGVEAERGLVHGQPVTLTVSSPTLDGDDHNKKRWHRAGVRINGIRDGILKTLTVRGGPALDTNPVAKHELALNRALGRREEVVIPAHGSTTEASVTATITGDVRLESVTLWVQGGRPSR